MDGFQVSLKYGKDTCDLDMPSSAATIGDLRNEIEAKMSVPKDVQQLICGGKRWQGIAFSDDLKVLEAAGSKGVKEVMGMKVVALMLMAPPGADGAEQVDRWQKLIEEAREQLATVEERASGPDAVKKELLGIDDMLSRAAEGLDSTKLVGAQRERRRDLLQQIQALEQEVTTRRSSLGF
mmetsp:Transcript_148011/g.258117  ORF Transcript_148011/g.258117 Transcript_148011/m.258117 type:complete len:180 (-) Transcript_148011:85-624(-)